MEISKLIPEAGWEALFRRRKLLYLFFVVEKKLGTKKRLKKQLDELDVKLLQSGQYGYDEL